MSDSRSKSDKLSRITRTMSQLFENERPVTFVRDSERNIQAPPTTPTEDEDAAMPESPRNELSEPHGEPETPPNHPFPPMDLEGRPSATTRSAKSRKRKSRRKENIISQNTTFQQRFQLSLVLENTGSVARDHLASERTFLAYVRTSLLLATTGVALVQLFAIAASNPSSSSTLGRIRQFGKPLGATLIGFGLLVLGIGVRRYFTIQRALTKGVFPITRLAIVGITIILAVIIAIIFGVLVSGRN